MATLLAHLRVKLSILIFIYRQRLRIIRWGLTYQPIAGGAPDGDGDGDSSDGDGDTDADADAGDDDSGDDDDGDADGDDGDQDGDKGDKDDRQTDWKRHARRHESEAKRYRRENDKLKGQLKKQQDAEKSAQQKAVDEAEKRGREGAQTEFEKERRQDRLENATVKTASKGLKIGDGDDAKTVRFADPDDAMIYLERDIANGDLDIEDIFDDKGKVRTDQLTEALTDLLERKPHLAAGNSAGSGSGGRQKAAGSADARKGTAASTDSTVESEFQKIRRNKK